MKDKRAFRILALENDGVCGDRLTSLLREHLDADVVVAQSGVEAIEAMSSKAPDLVLISALLSPKDETQLVAHLNEIGLGSEVPVLTVPPVIEALPAESRPPVVSFFGRQQKAPPLSYDTAAIVSRVREALEDARTTRLTMRLRVQERARTAADHHALIEAPKTSPLAIARRSDRAPHPRAYRWSLSDLPWRLRAETSWGVELAVLNVSRSGMLVESASKLMVDSLTEFRLLAEDRLLVMPARVVRSEVASVDSKGVRYRAAAVFSRQFGLIGDVAQSGEPSKPNTLSQLLRQLSAELEEGEQAAQARAQFERGLKRLAPCLDVKIQEAPVPPTGPRESIYFTIPCKSSFRAVLQASFMPDYEITAHEYRLLEQAAAAAGAVLGEHSSCLPAVVGA